jgi:glyoxylase-like metal-dependent hydrolase (beta-lactamase superfamily II)
MNENTYRFQVGHIQCTTISDGMLTYTPPTFPPPPTLLFANAPKDNLEEVLQFYSIQMRSWLSWTSPYNCLLINTGKHLVLVDTGADGLAPTTGRLIQNLRAEGISLGDIDTIVLTHGHPDHLGGITDSEGKLIFPTARYFISKTEWDFWMSPQAETILDEHSKGMLIGIAHKNLTPIKGRLEIVDSENEIVSGIRVFALPGHTPGQMGLNISSSDEKLVCISDVVLHPIHLEHPEWYATFDVDPAQTVATRNSILTKATVERTLVFAFHLPFPGLGYVIQKGLTWKWQPMQTLN